MRTTKKKAFTIIELLVVVSIIALLIGILLPAIGKARDQALQTRSLANLRQLGTAHATYAAEWNDNQWTTAPHNLAVYGSDLDSAISNFKAKFGGNPKSMSFDPSSNKAAVRLGFATEGGAQSEHFWYDNAYNTHSAAIPINFTQGNSFRRLGSYRMINGKPFNVYLSGRVYDMTFFAPKDRAVLGALGVCQDAPGEYCALNAGQPPSGYPFGAVPSSYILSPAALYSPDLWSKPGFTSQDVWNMPGSLRTPNFSQVRYPDLKTHMLEHHWLQRTRRECNPTAPEYIEEYNGCAPYFFNATRDSVPATLFYDGHVELMGVREAIQANAQAIQSAGGNTDFSLWHYETPMGFGNSQGYYHDLAYIPPGAKGHYTSYHILTRGGVFGRDTFSR